MNIDKEKVRELAIELYKCSVTIENNERIITEWLEQNQPEPIVVGLSDEQVESLTTHLDCFLEGILTKKDDIKFTIKDWLKTQTFVQPASLSEDVAEIYALESEVKSKELYINALEKELEQLKSQQLKPNWDDAPKESKYCRIYMEFQDKNYHTLKSNVEPLEFERPTPPAPKVEVGQVWEYKSISYVVISTGKVKRSTVEFGDEWLDCITYANETVNSDKPITYYTRTLDDFLAKFARVDWLDKIENWRQRPATPPFKVEVGQVWLSKENDKNWEVEVIGNSNVQIAFRYKGTGMLDIREVNNFIANFERVE